MIMKSDIKKLMNRAIWGLLLGDLSRGARHGVVIALLAASPGVLMAACPVEQSIDVTLTSGARWDLCIQSEDRAGLVLSEVHYTTPAGMRRQVLGEAHLAQVHLTFDDGRPSVDVLTDLVSGGGFGTATNRISLMADDCPGGTVRAVDGEDLLCVRERARGYSYKYYGNQKQGSLLELTARSQVSGVTWLIAGSCTTMAVSNRGLL